MKLRTYLSSALAISLTIGFLSSCESKKKAEEEYKADSLATDQVQDDTTLVTMEVSEPILSPSEKHFDAAVMALDEKKFSDAEMHIKEGVTAIKLEGSSDKGELKERFEKSVKKIEELEPLAKKEKLTSAELKKAFWPAELMVTHYMIEDWEVLPEFDVKANDHMKLTLDDFERKIANTEYATKEDGKKLATEMRSLLEKTKSGTEKDAKEASAKLKEDAKKLKEHIKNAF